MHNPPVVKIGPKIEIMKDASGFFVLLGDIQGYSSQFFFAGLSKDEHSLEDGPFAFWNSCFLFSTDSQTSPLVQNTVKETSTLAKGC